MQKDKDQVSRSETEKLQGQEPNPGRMAASDEDQRQQNRQQDRGDQQMPVGNEQNNQDTQGTVAGVGE